MLPPQCSKLLLPEVVPFAALKVKGSKEPTAAAPLPGKAKGSCRHSGVQPQHRRLKSLRAVLGKPPWSCQETAALFCLWGQIFRSLSSGQWPESLSPQVPAGWNSALSSFSKEDSAPPALSSTQ